MQFDFNVGAYQSQHIDVVGTFLKYKAGSGTIRVRLNGGGYIDLLPGQGVNNVNFTGVDVQDRTGLPNAGVILAGIYDFRDDRITGTVDVVDGGKSRSLSNCSFFGYASPVANPGQYGHVQLFNPAGSGRNIYLSRVMFSSIAPTPNGAHLAFYNTALGNLVGNGINKANGGAASVAELRTESFADVRGATLYAFYMPQNDIKVVDMKEPLVLTPGKGVCVIQGVPNYEIPTTFDYYEEKQ